MKKEMEERLVIRELLENWAVGRDALQWDRFRTVWHPEGQMWATWFQGSYEEFIRVNKEGYARGVRIYHMLGGSSIDVKGRRAIAQTKMSISQRAPVEGVVCDVLCTGRFYDFLEKRKGRWGLVWRRLFYERTGSIQSFRARFRSSTLPCSSAFPSATVTSPTFRPRSATR
jgi:hypothetical protein